MLLGCSSTAASAKPMKCNAWLKPTRTFTKFRPRLEKAFAGKVSVVSKSIVFRLKIVSSQLTCLQENLPPKKAPKDVGLLNSFSSYFLSFFYLCKDIVR